MLLLANKLKALTLARVLGMIYVRIISCVFIYFCSSAYTKSENSHNRRGVGNMGRIRKNKKYYIFIIIGFALIEFVTNYLIINVNFSKNISFITSIILLIYGLSCYKVFYVKS